LQSLDL